MRRTMSLVALAAVAGLAGGCGDSSDASPATEDELGQTSVSPSSTHEEDPAVAAYVAMWEDTAVASHTSDVDHPRLDDHATGEALMLLQYVIEGHAEEDQVAQGGPRHDVAVVESKTDRRELRDCMDGTDWLMYEKNGDLVNNKPGSHGLVEATVERRADGWIVTDLIMHGAATC
jgi:hypothetical protein